MKYLLLLRTEYEFRRLAPAEAQAIIEKYMAWSKKLRDHGQFVDGSPLADESAVVNAEGGVFTDSPLIETKDLIGGYFVIEAGSLAEAVDIAKETPGLELGGSVEVRRMGF